MGCFSNRTCTRSCFTTPAPHLSNRCTVFVGCKKKTTRHLRLQDQLSHGSQKSVHNLRCLLGTPHPWSEFLPLGKFPKYPNSKRTPTYPWDAYVPCTYWKIPTLVFQNPRCLCFQRPIFAQGIWNTRGCIFEKVQNC